ncbi:MAG: methyltransferase [Kordiimonadales bacterium]|nr:MAG: methyltransferase [Kordiimonadales bacterium]
MRKLLTAVAAVALLAASATTIASSTELFIRHGEEKMKFDGAKLEKILVAQPDEVKARYEFRHPKETLEFLGIAPGMTVIDTLPGGYYSNILLPYLGDKGGLMGVHYSIKHRTIDFGDNAERMERTRMWPEGFVKNATMWRGEGKTEVGAFLFGELPEDLKGKADAFLLFRAMHHLTKHEETGGTRTDALKDIYAALKPGGIVGIVQHRAPADSDDDWARGFNGYIKEAPLVAAMKAAGFEFVASSEINANPKDKPVVGDFVWRLPPSLGGAANKDEAVKAKMAAIGESDRMTLKFRKPA